MYGRYLLVLLLLGAVYAVQQLHELKRWWRLHGPAATAAVPAGAAHQGVLVYTANGCDPCEQMAEQLHRAGVAVSLRNVDAGDDVRAEFEDAGGQLPLLVDGQRRFMGYSPDFVAAWYVERPRNRVLLEQAGIYRRGEAREPIIYGTDWCGHCAEARRYFTAHGIPFRDLDIEHDPEALRQYDAIGLPGVPVMVYEDMIWNGFSAESMDATREWVGAR